MKRILFLFTVLALSAVAAAPVMAQDNPFVGTWKLNVAKSKFAGTPAPKSSTRTVVAEGAGAKYSFETVTADGTTNSYSFTTNYDGKDAAISGAGMPGGADTIALKRVSSHKATGTLKKGGTEVGTAEAEVSKDGKVTTVKTKGKGPDGKEIEATSVYDKQ